MELELEQVAMMVLCWLEVNDLVEPVDSCRPS